MKNKNSYIVIAIIVLVAIAFVTYFKSATSYNTYTDNNYDFTFEYPDTWHVVKSDLGNGFLQMYNYDENDPAYINEDFSNPSDLNKIEAVILDKENYDKIYAGQGEPMELENIEGEVSKIVRETENDTKVSSYAVPTKTGKEIIIFNIYGNEKNFRVLEKLVKSIKFY